MASSGRASGTSNINSEFNQVYELIHNPPTAQVSDAMRDCEALIKTGKTRLRPILMTAMTTILSMSVMVFSQDAGNAMQKSMAIVVSVGLLYSTLMTLIIVPIMYDILYRHTPKVIDVGSDLDVVPDETELF